MSVETTAAPVAAAGEELGVAGAGAEAVALMWRDKEAAREEYKERMYLLSLHGARRSATREAGDWAEEKEGEEE